MTETQPHRGAVAAEREPVDRLVIGGLLALCAVLALVLVAEGPGIVRAMGLNADLAAPLALADASDRYADAQFVTGRLGWWEGLWLLQLIQPLPGWPQTGAWLPLLLFGATGLAVLAQARRLWGTRAAAAAALALLGTSGTVWVFQSSWSGRAPTWIAMGLLGLVVTALAREGRSPARTALLLALGALASVHAGAALSGDSLALPAVLAPLGACAFAFAALRRWASAGAVAALLAVAGASALAAGSLARSGGYLMQEYPMSFVRSDSLLASLDNTIGALAFLWQGPRGFGAPFGELAFAGVVGGLAGIVLVAVALAAGCSFLLRSWDGRTASLAPAVAARSIWTTYWLTATVAMLVAFWLTVASAVEDALIARYLFGVPLAAAALVAVAVAGRGRSGVVALLAAGTVGSVALVACLHTPPGRDVPVELERIAQVVEDEGVSRGYAGYWTSYPLAYASDFELDVTPVGECSAPVEGRLCAMYLHYVDRAYSPRRGPTFLVVDRRPGSALGYGPSQATWVASNMDPESMREVSPEVSVYLFDHDIAQDLRANSGLKDPRIGRGGPLAPR